MVRKEEQSKSIMSIRPVEVQSQQTDHPLRVELESMRERAAQDARAAETAACCENGQTPVEFESLNETERSAAMLGVNPSDWKPISFMNKQHYADLLQNNALDERLVAGVEAYKAVSQGVA